MDLLRAIDASELGESSRLSAALSTEADGNPFFIREILSNLVETGKLVYHERAWVTTAGSVEDLGIPEGVKEVVGRRLSRLSVGCNGMLQRASAWTNGFTWDELKAISDGSEDDLLDQLDEALSAHLLEERGGLAYGFTHALIRATLYEELSGPRRVALHRRVAEALEGLYEQDLDTHLGELAAHYLSAAGGDAHKAVKYSIRAGDRAMEQLAWEEASRHYERALEAIQLTGTPYAEERCRILLALADCNRLSSAVGQTILDLLRQAAEIARQIGSAELLALAATKFETAADQEPDDLSGERLALLDEALALLGNNDSAVKALVMAFRTRAAAASANAASGRPTAGFMVWAGPKNESVLTQAREALAMAERVREERVIVLATYFYHSYSWSPDNDAERLQMIDRALTVARESQEPTIEVDVLGARAGDLLALGDVAEFRRNATEFLASLERVGYRAQRYLASAMQVGLLIAEGRLAEAEERLSEVSDGTPTGATVSLGQLYFLRHQQGRLPELADMWRAIVAGQPGMLIMQAGLIQILASAGEAEAAAREIDNVAADDFVGVPRDLYWKATLAMIGDSCA